MAPDRASREFLPGSVGNTWVRMFLVDCLSYFEL